jgi:hypothetical protein
MGRKLDLSRSKWDEFGMKVCDLDGAFCMFIKCACIGMQMTHAKYGTDDPYIYTYTCRERYIYMYTHKHRDTC